VAAIELKEEVWSRTCPYGVATVLDEMVWSGEVHLAMSRLAWGGGQHGEEAGSRSIMDLLHSGFVNLGLKS